MIELSLEVRELGSNLCFVTSVSVKFSSKEKLRRPLECQINPNNTPFRAHQHVKVLTKAKYATHQICFQLNEMITLSQSTISAPIVWETKIFWGFYWLV